MYLTKDRILGIIEIILRDKILNLTCIYPNSQFANNEDILKIMLCCPHYLIIGNPGPDFENQIPMFYFKKTGTGTRIKFGLWKEKERWLAWQILTGMLNHSVSQFSALLVSCRRCTLTTSIMQRSFGNLVGCKVNTTAAVLILSSQKIVPLLHILIQHI